MGAGCQEPETGEPTFPRHAGDILTLLRVIVTPVFVAVVWCARQQAAAGWLAVLLFAAIAASDVFDGYLARQAGGASETGRLLDHGADIFFVLAALGSYVILQVTPWWVPAAIAVSFASYVYDSFRTPTAGVGELAPSRIGHVGGVLNYALVGVLVCNESAALHSLPGDVMDTLYLLVPIYSGAAIVQRLRASWAVSRSAREETRGR